MTTLTDKIRQCTRGVVDNPYQGDDKKVVFVCSAGILRSATAARIYAHKYNTRACGSYPEFALIPITEDLVAWADEVVFVKPENYQKALERVPLNLYKEKIKVLDIPDEHMHMAPELIKEFEKQYEPL